MSHTSIRSFTHSYEYLFEYHSFDEVRELNRRLKYFRYFRAYGGFANDGDSLDAAIRYDSSEDLLCVLSELGIKTNSYTVDPTRLPIPGIWGRSELRKYPPSIIEGTKWIEQPWDTNIFGYPANVWGERDRIIIRPVGRAHCDISEAQVVWAESIEKYLIKLSDRIIDPPRKVDHYLCAANYPELGSEQASSSNGG